MSNTETTMGLPEIHDWVFSELGFCGCGDPEGALDLLRSVLLAIRTRHDENEIEESEADSQARWSRNSEVLRKLINMDVNAPLAWTYLYFVDSKGLLEHGGNCAGSWLTERGEQILDALLKYDSESIIECDEQESVLDAEIIS